MTVIRLLTAQPEENDKGVFFFGIFPFPRASSIPYDMHPATLEKCASTLNFIKTALRKADLTHGAFLLYFFVKDFDVYRQRLIIPRRPIINLKNIRFS